MRFAFDGEIGPLINVNNSVPQGLPISPIMFLIYIHHIFEPLRRWLNVTALSYADDIGIITGSTNPITNCNRLRKVLKVLNETADQSQIKFDEDKMEFMHFHNRRQPMTEKLIHTFNAEEGLKTIEVPPQEQIKWLGIWLDRKLTFKKHVEVRAAAAARAFHSIRRLSNTTKGLSFQAIRQLYIACVEAVGAYGVPLWWSHNHSRIKVFEKLQNSALRTILGQFRTASIGPIEIEAVIPPIRVQFEKIAKFYGIQVLQLQPNHPVRELLIAPRRLQSSPAGIRIKKIEKRGGFTQLEMIMRSIGYYEGYYKLESFKFQKDLPWKPTIDQLPDVTVRISEKSKEKNTLIG